MLHNIVGISYFSPPPSCTTWLTHHNPLRAPLALPDSVQCPLMAPEQLDYPWPQMLQLCSIVFVSSLTVHSSRCSNGGIQISLSLATTTIFGTNRLSVIFVELNKMVEFLWMENTMMLRIKLWYWKQGIINPYSCSARVTPLMTLFYILQEAKVSCHGSTFCISVALLEARCRTDQPRPSSHKKLSVWLWGKNPDLIVLWKPGTKGFVV